MKKVVKILAVVLGVCIICTACYLNIIGKGTMVIFTYSNYVNEMGHEITITYSKTNANSTTNGTNTYYLSEESQNELPENIN